MSEPGRETISLLVPTGPLTSRMQGTAQARFLLRGCFTVVDNACENIVKTKAQCWRNGVLVRWSLFASALKAAPDAEALGRTESTPQSRPPHKKVLGTGAKFVAAPMSRSLPVKRRTALRPVSRVMTERGSPGQQSQKHGVKALAADRTRAV